MEKVKPRSVYHLPKLPKPESVNGGFRGEVSVLASAGNAAKSKFAVIWNIEIVPLAWSLAETLGTVESHILDHHNRSIHDQNHVELGMRDDGSLVFLDDST